MSAKHTPGPWDFTAEHGLGVYVHATDEFTTDVAEMICTGHSDEAVVANARNTWADTMPMGEIEARQHPLPHPQPARHPTIDLADMERSVIAARRRACEHVLHSTFGRTSQAPRHAPAPRTHHRIVGASLLLIGIGLAGYAFGLALVALSNVAGVAA